MVDHSETGKALEIRTLTEEVANLKGEFRDLAEGARGALVQQVETSPIASILIATGIGFLASFLIRLSHGSRARALNSRRSVRRARHRGDKRNALP